LKRMHYLISIENDAAVDPGVVGHKFASLAKAVRWGFRVPKAFAVSVEACQFYRRNKAWPEKLQDRLRNAIHGLDLSRGISVRSSSTREDLEDKSFAGQYKTYLDVRNERDLMVKIEKCWESAASESVLSYLDDPANPVKEGPPMAVILQRMVHAKAAGVAFSRNPMYPSRNEVVVEGVSGLGEKLVSGHVTPYRAFVRSGRVVIDENGVRRGSPDTAILNALDWRKIAQMAKKAETAHGKPQDIEWAVDENDTLWLLQSRPITAIRATDLKAPSGTWTRKIAEDLWADRLTPLLADAMMINTPRFDLSNNLEFLKIPIIRPSLSVINGFLYINCEGLKQLLTLLPQKFRISELRALFPPGFEIDSVPSPSLGKLFSSAVRSIFLGLVQPQGNLLFCRYFTRLRLKRLQSRLDGIERLPHETAQEALLKSKESLECLALLQEINQWPYLYATLFTWVLRWAVKDLGGLDHSGFLYLLSTDTDNVTTRIEQEIKKLAEGVTHHENLLNQLKNSPEQMVGSLPRPLQNAFDQFLFKYGCRSRHRTLYVKRWAEAPEEVLGMMATLSENSKNGSTPKAPPLPAAALLKRLPRHLRLPVRPLLRYTCRFLNLREDMRFFLDKILYRIRRSLLMLGKHTGLGEDVLFLTQSELERMVEGRIGIEEAGRLALGRKNEFLKKTDVYTFYIDGRPIDELPSRANIIGGIGTSPGRVTGRARIVDDPTKGGIMKGDILIAKNTDPGWTPVLRIVGGIVVEEGGILNHCSIVARELGIPAVVGVRQATRKIRENALITIDGGLGVVQPAEQ
jgi:phosphohistidine swiveling domain-containing protein